MIKILLIAIGTSLWEGLTAQEETMPQEKGSKLTAKLQNNEIGLLGANSGADLDGTLKKLLAADFYVAGESFSGGGEIELPAGSYSVDFSATIYSKVATNGIDANGDVLYNWVADGQAVRGTLNIKIEADEEFNLFANDGELFEILDLF